MKWRLSNGIIFGVTVALAGMSAEAAPGTQKDAHAAADLKLLLDGNSQFATDLYRELRKKEGNLFFSPYSVSNALALVLAGARGDTAKEIANVLSVQGVEKDFHAAFGRLNKLVQSGAHDEKSKLLVANAFWRQEGLSLLPAFIDGCAQNYEVELGQSDFVRDSEGARLSINKWVQAKTKDKIKELLRAGSLNDKTRFVLVNAVYFKGKWPAPFDKKFTKNEDFLAGFKDRVQVPAMKQTLITDYHSNDGLQVVALPYADNRLSLYVFVGQSEKAFRAFESHFSPGVVNELLGRLRKHVVDLSIPKFQLKDEMLLSGPLGGLGMSTLFSLNADLSGIADSREKLSVAAVIHKSCLEVNEEGTEAAAATGVVGVTPISFSKPIPSARVVLDRPFLFFVRHNQTGAVLFIGRLMNPRDQ